MTAVADRNGLAPAEVRRRIEALLGAPLAGSHGSELRYVCPLHRDAERDSFTINGDTGLYYCHACQAQGNLPGLEAAIGGEGNGLAPTRTARDGARRSTPGPRQPRPSLAGWTQTLYDYRDEAGALRYQVVRRDPPAGSDEHKTISQRRPTPDGGFIRSLAGVLLAPYRLPELLAAPDDLIFICEGEKACEAVRELGLVATTNPMGAGKWPRSRAGQDRGFRPEEAEAFNAWFRGRAVVILPDNDEPGERHALQVARALAGVAAEVRILRLPGLSAKGDAFDWIAGGGTREALQALAAEAPIEELPAEEAEPDVTATLARLAALPAIDYERCRKAEAKVLGMRPAVLDHFVTQERAKAAPPTDAPPKLIPDLEPWPDPVEGAALLAELQATVHRFVVLSPEAGRAVALWIVHTHAIDAASITPILGITSPEKRCGKSTLLGGLLRRLVSRPLLASNITSSAVYRAIEAFGPTLLIDEADSFLRENEELRGVLNSGHGRDTAQVIRNVETRDGIEPRAFSTWGAKAIALIGGLPSTLTDRAIEIRLMRKFPGEATEKIRYADPDTFRRLARQAARWAEDSIEALRALRPAIPDELHDRAADNWEALLAIADLAGGPWPAAGREAALALSRSGSDSESLGTRLLGDLRTTLAGRTGVVSTTSILEALNGIEEAPWSEACKGKPLNPRKLANLLRPFGVKPGTVREGSGTPKGYTVAELEKVFSRYLGGSYPQHPPQSHGEPVSSALVSATNGELWRIEFDPGSPIRANVADVADRNPGGLVVEVELYANEELIA